ncbi:MAG TPA: DUF5131 family protein [Cytophagaceae bacterium]
MRKISVVLSILLIMTFLLTACDEIQPASKADVKKTLSIGDKLAANQPTPNDIDYSLERYNLIRRAYWVNGQREKARTLPCPIADIPLGYIILFTVSIEPLLDEIVGIAIENLKYFDWVIIGAETGNRKGKVIPKREWVENIVSECKQYGIPVFMKNSLRDIMGSDFIQELPEQIKSKGV